MFRRQLFVLLYIGTLCGCTSSVSDKTGAEAEDQADIIDSILAFHGDSILQMADVSFGFRQKDFTVTRNADHLLYACIYRDSLGLHKQVLVNEGYTKWINGKAQKLSPADSVAQASALNSVIYFALLPMTLADEAVEMTRSGVDTIAARRYYKLEVHFSESAGGDDFDDVFYFWIDVNDYSMDYLAYSFREKESGTRFRKAYNQRRINGMMFQDYENYQGPADPDSLPYILDLYRSDHLSMLSKIELSRIRVRPQRRAK